MPPLVGSDLPLPWFSQPVILVLGGIAAALIFDEVSAERLVRRGHEVVIIAHGDRLEALKERWGGQGKTGRRHHRSGAPEAGGGQVF